MTGMVDKVELLPFAETMPSGMGFALASSGVVDWADGLYDLFPEAENLDRVSEPGILEVAGARLGVAICYEDVLPDFMRRLMAVEPDLVVNLTNDAWFGISAEPYQHLAAAVLRAVEVRRGMVRATNTGVSAFIQPTGAVTAQTKLTEPEMLVESMPLLQGQTLYARMGDVFVYLCMAGIVGWIFWRRRGHRETR